MPDPDGTPPAAPDSPAVTQSIADPATNTGGHTTIPTPPAAPPAGTARYALAEEIARGGMGVVYRATDETLGREVAVKVLQEKYSPDSDAAGRFADEARITGQLQHPAIPPVHDLGVLPDGRPFLAMKLIKGATLDRLLEDRPDPSIERGRFVAVFEQVCQALAYAHSKDVIHRDLKPANVMVGAFGEVQVMDWGLAKVLADQPAPAADPEETAGASRVVSLRDSDGSFTQAGSVLGTPAFMPPEQAVGAVGKVDARSDVFGLGAILAVILTGKPPFAAGSSETVRVLSAQGKLEECFARLDACGADPELVALCKRCLAPSPAERPADAGEVAKAVAGLRAAADERTRQADLARAAEEARAVEARISAEQERKAREAAQAKSAAERRARRLTVVLAAVVLAAAVGVGAAALGWQRDQAARAAERDRRAAETEKSVTAALGEAEALTGQAATLKDDPAGWQAALAEGLSAAKRAEGFLAADEGMDVLRRRVAEVRATLEAADRDRHMITRLEEAQLQNAEPGANGSGYDNEGSAALFAAAFKEYLGVDLLTLDPADATARINGRTIRQELLAGLADWSLMTEDDRRAIIAILKAADPDAASFRNRLRTAVHAQDLETLKRMAADEAAHLSARDVEALGRALGAVGAEPEALQLLRAAQQRFPNVLWINYDLGQHLQKTQPPAWDEAARFYTVAASLQPHSAGIHRVLGGALYRAGKLDEAITELRRAVELRPDLVPAHIDLGDALYAKGDLDGAEAACREAIRFDPKYALAHFNLGGVLRDKGNMAGAEAEYRGGIRLDPNNAGAHNGLGVVLDRQGDLIGAEAEYRESIRLDPNNAWAHNNLGWALQQKGDLDGAIAEYKEALRIDPKQSNALSNLPIAERMRLLKLRLPDILEKKAQPQTPEEACEFAELCALPFQKRFAAAVRLYEGAFADPKMAANLAAIHSYDAACCAVRAAGGEGIDVPADTAARTALRRKALGWLRADLVLHQKEAVAVDVAQRGQAARALSIWLVDLNLSGVRDPEPLAKLPADERDEWQKLWADLKATLADARKQAPPPVPIAGQSFEKGWDGPVDPDGDCKITPSKGSLTIEVPAGKRHDLVPKRGIVNAPRLLRDVNGDFTMQVRVYSDCYPVAPSTPREGVPYLGAGIVLSVGDQTILRLERAGLSRGVNDTYHYINWEGWADGRQLWSAESPNAAEVPTYLRLRCQGDLFFAAFSKDGVAWTELPPQNVKLPTAVKVGVSAVSTSSGPLQATFDDFRIGAGGAAPAASSP